MSRLGAVFGRKFKNKPASRAQDPALSEEPLGPAHVGQILRECREHYGEDIEGIALALRIRMAYLEAIEDGRFHDLPGPTYVQGFLRAYADYLGLDSGALLKRYRVDAPISLGRMQLDFPVAPGGDEARFPTAAVLFLSLILAGAAGAGWYYFEAPIQRRVATVTDGPLPGNSAKVQIPAAQAPATAVVPTEQPQAVGAAQTFLPEVAQERPITPPVVTAPPLVQPVAPPVERVPERPQGPEVAAAPPAEPMPAPAPGAPAADNAPRLEQRGLEQRGLEQRGLDPPGLQAIPLPPGVGVDGAARVYGQTNLDARIVIVAIADSWIQVRDETRNDIFTRMLRAGDSYRVPNRPGLVMLTGNAGGLEFTIDGVKAPALGALGEVTRDIPLDPEALKQGHAEAR